MIDLNTFWANTDRETIEQLLEHVDSFGMMPKRAWFKASLRAELRRRDGEDVKPLTWWRIVK